jgi:hypothetical protein
MPEILQWIAAILGLNILFLFFGSIRISAKFGFYNQLFIISVLSILFLSIILFYIFNPSKQSFFVLISFLILDLITQIYKYILIQNKYTLITLIILIFLFLYIIKIKNYFLK